MTEIVPFPTDNTHHAGGPRREATLSVRGAFSVDETLRLVEKAAESLRVLQTRNRELEAEADALRQQVKADRSDWQIELARIDRELEVWQKKFAESETLCRTLEVESQTAFKLCADADYRTVLAVRRAEAAEARCRTVEGWLVRIQETVVSEFSDLILRAAS